MVPKIVGLVIDNCLTGKTMQEINKVEKKIMRRNFFLTSVKGMFIFMVLNSFPLNLIMKKNNKSAESGKIKVKLNPQAVSRKNIGGKNG